MNPMLHAIARAAWNNAVSGKPTPLILLLEPSERCNARCSFCYHWREKPGPELTIDDIDRLLEDAWKLGCRFLYLSGGEPTIYPDVEQVLCLAKRLGYNISMTTNGSTLAASLPRLAPHLDGVTVSIDFAGTKHDEVRGIPGLYQLAVDGVARAVSLGLPARINMSLHPGNMDDVEPLVELARGLGAGLHIRLLTRESSRLDVDGFSPDEARQAARRILAIRRRNRDVILTPATYFKHIASARPFDCRPLSLLMTVDSSGRLYVPCPKWEGTKERIAGNIKRHSLESVWNSAAAWAVRREAADCTPNLDCYTSCILDISLLAKMSPAMMLEQVMGGNSLLSYFWRKR